VTSIGRIIIVGPASPAALSSHLSGADRQRAAAIKGMGAGPVRVLVKALLERGFAVDLVTLTSQVTELQHLSGPALDIRIGPYRKRARRRARDFFAAERRAVSDLLALASGDVVHAHWTYEFALACEHERRPVLVTAHDAPLTTLRLQRDAYRVARTILAYRARLGIRTMSAVSPYLAHRWRREMAYRRPIKVVPNISVDLPVLAPQATKAHRLVLDVTEDDDRKNVASLIRAFSEVRRVRPDTVLRLVGTGLSPTDRLAGWARANGLDTAVEFVGPVAHSAIPYHLAEADVFAHAALEEAHPVSVCEAMHAGLPIVGGRRSGGVPWTLDEGRCGLLADVRDPGAIADGILRLFADPGLSTQLGQAARSRAVTTFGADAVVRGYLDGYATAIQEQAPAKTSRSSGPRRTG
jgi:glycosyltransferase involved in cell wall biosynthesis